MLSSFLTIRVSTNNLKERKRKVREISEDILIEEVEEKGESLRLQAFTFHLLLL